MAGAYRAACAAAGSRVLVTVEEGYTAGFTSLLLNGHRTMELLDARLSDLDVAPLAVALSEMHPFTVLDLSYNQLGAGAAESLSQLIKSDRTVQTLDLSENLLTSHAVEALCTALKTNSTIREVRLSGNKLGGAGGMAIAEMLQTNTSIERLHLSNCELTTEALVALATVLRDNRQLLVLDVSRPLAATIMDEPASHFARTLKLNTSLQELNLSKSGLRDFGLRLLAEELYRAGAASQLRELRLRCNRLELVDEDCVTSFAMLLTSDACRISTLTLGGNRLGDEGALKLAEMLSENRSLLELDVSSNSLRSRGLCALARATSKHLILSQLELSDNSFDTAACLAWLPLIESSRKLTLDFAVQKVDGAYHCVRC